MKPLDVQGAALLPGQGHRPSQRVRPVVMGPQRKLGQLLQQQPLVRAKAEVAVFYVRLEGRHPDGLVLRAPHPLDGEIHPLPGRLLGQLLF